MFIVVTGTPIDGFRFFGPFSDGNEATEYAATNCESDHCESWWVVKLEKPE